MKEKLRSEELRQKQAGPVTEDGHGKLTSHFCGKPGHDCRKWAAEKRKRSEQSQ